MRRLAVAHLPSPLRARNPRLRAVTVVMEADEPAAARPRADHLPERAAALPLVPAQEPHGPAVVPGARTLATGDLHGIAGDGHLVVDLGVGGRHVDAAMADVGEALLADGPIGVVQV